MNLKIRLAEDKDMAFIHGSWLKSYRNNGMAKDILNEVYFDNHRKIIESLQAKGAIYVGHPDGEPDLLMGFVAIDDAKILHYVYVKQTFRKMQVAQTLIKKFIPDFTVKLTEVTHIPKNARAAMIKFKLCYNPYYLYKEL